MKLLLLISLLHLTIVLAPPAAALYEPWAHDCSGYPNSNSTYKANLDSLLTEITTVNAPTGFYNLVAGKDPDQVFLKAQCRGDMLTPVDCHACLASVKANLTATCPADSWAVVWADNCMLYYNSGNISGLWDSSPKEDKSTELSVGGNVDHFAEVVEGLLMSLPNQTAGLHKGIAFAAGEASVNASHTIYALMECTPDLITSDCLGCLYWNMYDVLYSLRGQTGARVVTPSCSIRYELYKFYAVPSSGSGWSINPKTVAICVLAALNALILIVFAILIYLVVTRRKQDKLMEKATQVAKVVWDFKTIKRATRNFSKPLGISGQSRVYRGVLDNEGVIAVKRIKTTGSDAKEFKKAVSKAIRLDNPNLAQVKGYCVQSNERLVIFQFYSKGSLDLILFDPKYRKERAKLDWQKRYKIIKGIAVGLHYLHKQCNIWHRDLKPANVLLDDQWMPKITDIGTGNSFQEDNGQTHADAQAEAAVVLIPQSHAQGKAREKGTTAYMAPEYLDEGISSDKSDVYSFGVIVLEIVTGRRRSVVSSQDDLVSLARTACSDGTWLQIIDAQIKPGTNSNSAVLQMKECIDMALECVDGKAEQRPAVSSVFEMLAKLDHPPTSEHIPNSSP